MIHETGGYSTARDDVIGMELDVEGLLEGQESRHEVLVF